MKKLFRKIHLWLSVPFGIIISLICFSGAMLVFEKEITESINSKLFFVEKVEDKSLPVDTLVQIASASLDKGVEITGVTLFSDPRRAAQISLSKPRRASLYIDQYSGQIKGNYKRLPFFDTMFKMHRWLMGSSRSADGGIGLGKLIVGISTLMFVIVLLSGVVIWWPRNKKMLVNRISIQFKKGWKRLLYDLHVAAGIYATLLLLAMALTGLTWSFQWYRNGFYTLFGVETVQSTAHNTEQKKSGKEHNKKDDNNNYHHWQTVYEQLALKNSDYKQITISNGSASVSFDKMGNQRAADKYIFNPSSGEITAAELYNEQSNSKKIRGWIYSVHVGSWGGIITRILTFLSALLGATLPLTGYYLWIKRILQKK